jgi:hypothetical protein
VDGTLLPRGVHVYPLSHFDRDLFIGYPSAETPDLPGKAMDVTIDRLNDVGLGALKRVAE